MTRRYCKQFSILLSGAFLMLALVANPAQAHDYDNVIVPLATGFVLGSLFQHGHGHGHHYYYSKHRRAYHGHSGHYGHQYRRRAYSTGHGGYKRKSQSHGYSRKSRSVYHH
jgi:uncharacterized protein YgiB involved in biofilm formation